MKRVLVVAAHPDDEILGCGGTMAAHVAAGDEVAVVIVAEGVTSRADKRDLVSDANDLAALRSVAERANAVVGVQPVSFCEFPDNRMDSVDLLDVVKAVENHVRDVRPDIVYTHFGSDLNIDHRRVSEAVVTACRPVPDSVVAELLFFEVPSSTEWQVSGSRRAFFPNWHVDIRETLAAKCRALEIYESEMRDWPHARSIRAVEHLARWRGASVGLEAAEAFVVGRVMRRLQASGGTG